MDTDLSSATVAGLFVAGLGAVYAYTQLGPLLGAFHGHTHTEGDEGEERRVVSSSETVRRGRKKKKGKGGGVGGDEVEGKGTEGTNKDKDKGKAKDKDTGNRTTVVPGDFETADTTPSADVSSRDGDTLLAGIVSKPGNSGKTKKKKKKRSQGRVQDQVGAGGEKEEGEEGEETDKEADTRGLLRSGDSTDADIPFSLSPSTSLSTSAFSRPVGKSTGRAAMRLVAPPIRPSLSFDTDSSWTHIDRRRLGSTPVDGLGMRLVDAMDVTSSDLASTESSSPVAERAEGGANDVRGTCADLAQRTLAEKLVPRPEETGVDDMLEQSDFPTLARVIRIQPGVDETPAPGFSWEDYGDVVEDSLLVHDADQEDEGEWGIVKSRNRTRPPQTTTTNATSHAVVTAPETMTKKQRQNARKRELAKSVKAEAEAVRLQGLAKHKRELERLRIIEQSRQGGGKRPSGGMQATVDDRGKLVWE